MKGRHFLDNLGHYAKTCQSFRYHCKNEILFPYRVASRFVRSREAQVQILHICFIGNVSRSNCFFIAPNIITSKRNTLLSVFANPTTNCLFMFTDFVINFVVVEMVSLFDRDHRLYSERNFLEKLL